MILFLLGILVGVVGTCVASFSIGWYAFQHPEMLAGMMVKLVHRSISGK